MNTYPRETKEFLSITIKRNGERTNTFEVTTTTGDERPTNWTPAETLGQFAGILINNMQPGKHTIWARVTADPETPVIRVGDITID